MARDDSRQRRIGQLLREYHAYNEDIEALRRQQAQLAREKSFTVAELRKLLPVADVAALLGVTPAAVYKLLSSSPVSSASSSSAARTASSGGRPAVGPTPGSG